MRYVLEYESRCRSKETNQRICSGGFLQSSYALYVHFPLLHVVYSFCWINAPCQRPCSPESVPALEPDICG
ncbi:hypothetical protein Leryth_013128 [Lithospermum erythrorhizon]|nr:hypothetical protein Leryth_013128 [Lithospermum erythrorhizon]